MEEKTAALSAEPKRRNASFELLRVLCMLLIILSHAISCGGIAAVTAGAGLSRNYVLIWIIRAFCRISVPCFVLVSGYFMCCKSLHLRKIVQLWCTAFFYSIVIYLVMCALGVETFSARNTVLNLLPVTTQRHWFVSSYMMMLVWTPVLNRAIAAMNRKQHFLLVVGFGILYGPMADIMRWAFDFTRAADGYSYIYFLFLYLVAAYLRKYPPKAPRRHRYVLGYIGLSLLIAGITMLLEQLEGVIPTSLYTPYVFYNINSVLVLLSAVCVFQWFRTLEFPQGRAASLFLGLGGLTFGVYLIHEHQSLRVFLWNSLLHVSRHALSLRLFPYLACCVVGVFVVCACIEWVRKALFRLLRIDRGISRLSDNVETRVLAALDRHFDSESS